MRYWHPLTEETAREVAAWRPDRVLLVPLYPQFSTTTTASSLAAWTRAAKAASIAAPTQALCCYPDERGFVEAVAAEVRGALTEAGGPRPRILFSAHGLPEKIVTGGDPYQWQVERTVAAIVAAIGAPDLDYSVCYQSRVGPLAWIGPATDAEIRRAGADGVPVVVVPVAFVSEHSETLVELDIEYRHLADAAGVPGYRRLPTVGAAAPFIRGLAGRIRALAAGDAPLCSGEGGRICPQRFGRCAFAAGVP
jgi:ferrochelatase